MDKKVGRNDPCPCGSGKKYKNCCMGKDESKKTYTAAGKRKFKATVLSLQDKTQSIFSAKPQAPTIGAPPTSYPFLRFKQTSVDYRKEAEPLEISYPIVTSTETDFPMPESQVQGEVSLPEIFVMTTLDYRDLRG